MELVIVIGILLVALWVFTGLLKVVRATVRIAILIAIVLLVVFVVSVGPQTLWEQIQPWLPGFAPGNSQ